MRIGIDFSITPHDGGKYWYCLEFLRALRRLEGLKHEFILFYAQDSNFDPSLKEGDSFKAVTLPNTLKDMLPLRILKYVSGLRNRVRRAFQKYDIRQIRQNVQLTKLYETYRIELILCPASADPIINADIPGVFCVHDVQHRIWPEFPEVAHPRIRDEREAYYLNGIERALFVVAPSEVAREDVTILYNKSKEDIVVLPYPPPEHMNSGIDQRSITKAKERLKLPEQYLFYPACYWPHKNHVRIVQALTLLKREKGLRIPVVFVGDDKQDYGVGSKIRKAVKEGNVADLVYQLGFVPQDDISALYAGARALVMPTFFGPTNIPYLEAFQMGCPVITSDLRGIRDQVSNAACLINPRSVESIAEGILRVWQDESYRRELIRNGYKIINQWSSKDFTAGIENLLQMCEARLSTGRKTSSG